MNQDTLYKPEVFQGTNHTDHYFEGWYFKCVDKNAERILVVIPGIAYEGDEAHSFIQVCLPHKQESYYFSFPKEAFGYRLDTLYIQVENNIFTDKYIYLDLKNEQIHLKGLLWFSQFVPAPVKVYSPGIMGPFGLLPFLECYHGVVSMNHGVKGFLEIDGVSVPFEGGKGYVEKDWGKSFPKAYMWLQCNHFQKQTLSVMVSVARIPMGNYHFRGFLCAIAIRNQVRIFATYTGAKIKQLNMTKDQATITITQGKERIVIDVKVPKGHLLKAPVKGAMKRTIYETLQGEITLRMYHEDVLRVWETSKFCAYEMSGDPTLLKA